MTRQPIPNDGWKDEHHVQASAGMKLFLLNDGKLCWILVEFFLVEAQVRVAFIIHTGCYEVPKIKAQKSKLQFWLFHILFSIQFCLPSLTKLLSRQWYSSCSFDVTFGVFVSDMKRCITKTFVLLTHPRSSCTRSHLRHWQSHLKRDFDLTWSKD